MFLGWETEGPHFSSRGPLCNAEWDIVGQDFKKT